MLVKKCLLVLAIFISAYSIAQEVKTSVFITGTVMGSDKTPLSGVSVKLKSSAKKVISDADGKFTLIVDSTVQNDSLVFVTDGFEKHKVLYDKLIMNYTITLKETDPDQNEVVTMGYGTQKKKDVIGSVASGSKEKLESSSPNNNFASSQQGSVTGVAINSSSSSSEGNDLAILSRGRGSFSLSNSPLIILDGTVFSGNISDISPSDIASIDILKDASSIAVYGAKGSNGVIMITTKSGKKGKMVFRYDVTYGLSTYIKKPDLMNGSDFYNFKSNRIVIDSLNGQGLPQTPVFGNSYLTANEIYNYQHGINTDWFKEATQTGNRLQNTLSLSGSTEKTRYFFSGSVLSVKGIAKNDQFKRYTLRSNVDYKAAKWLTFTSNTQLVVINRDGIPADISGSGTGVLYLNPLTVPYDSTGKLTLYPWDPYNPNSPVEKIANPLGNLLVKKQDNQYKMITSNAFKVDIPYVKGLTYKLNTGVEVNYTLRNTYYGLNTVTGYTNSGEAKNYDELKRNFLVENILNYSHEFGVHTIGLTGVYSMQSEDDNKDLYTGIQFPSDVLTNYQMSSAAKLTQTTSFAKTNTLSQLIRLNYAYKGKYSITFSTRRDGYSVFGDGLKYGIFPSGAAGWQVSQEEFMKKSKVSKYITNLKVRASYGLSGNNAIPAYSSLASFDTRTYITYDSTTAAGVVRNGVIIKTLANPNLGWESQKQFDIGLDVGLLKGRINLGFDYYDKNNFNLLLQRPLPPEMGVVDKLYQNIGEVENQGVELSISTVNITNKDFTWTSQINYSSNKNEIKHLYGNGVDSDTGAYWFKGHPIQVYYDYQYDGVWQKNNVPSGANILPGFAKVQGYSGLGSVSPSLKQIIGQKDPKYHFGFTNTFKYRNISLSIFLQGAGGNVKLDNLQSDDIGLQITNNVINRNWWTLNNPTNEHWSNDANANPSSIKIYEDASYIRVRDITITYNIPSSLLSKAKITNFKIYFTARNLATFTKFKGIDPEIDDTNKTTDDGRGGQWGLPLAKEFTLGASLTF